MVRREARQRPYRHLQAFLCHLQRGRSELPQKSQSGVSMALIYPEMVTIQQIPFLTLSRLGAILATASVANKSKFGAHTTSPVANNNPKSPVPMSFILTSFFT